MNATNNLKDAMTQWSKLSIINCGPPTADHVLPPLSGKEEHIAMCTWWLSGVEAEVGYFFLNLRKFSTT